MAEPVGDAERAELGKVAVVEDQNEVAGLVAQAGKRVGMTAGKVPDIAGIEVVDFRATERIYDSGSDSSL